MAPDSSGTTANSTSTPANGSGVTRRTSPVRAAISGILAALAALAAGELVAAMAPPRPGPVIAVANRVIDEAPTWFVDFGKTVFGLADKPALLIGTVLITALAGAAVGIGASRRWLVGVLAFLGFGLVGWLAIALDAQAGPASATWISIVTVGAGLATLGLLLIAAHPTGLGVSEPEPADAPRATTAPTPAPTTAPTSALANTAPVGRRSFFQWAAVAGGTVGAMAAAGKVLRGRSIAEEARSQVEILASEDTNQISALVQQAESHPVAQVDGISPVVVPNSEFYRIDTATLVPQVDPSNWELEITGMVDRKLTFTYEELLARATTVAPVTLSCVSNQIGGDLVGNAVWQGIPLAELLDEAGVQPGADQIRSASVDGWDCGFPTEAAFDGRTALVAVAMNGEPLPVRHGFPARLVIAGLYGYVSATKWLSEIELTTMADFDGYWIPRGWSKSGPIKTQSRIDTPRNGETVAAGSPVAIGGVAWAPNSGITKVEIKIDEDDWAEAELGEALGINAWRQWHMAWTPTDPGQAVIRVRATDGTGTTQTSEITEPAPNGASGWHNIGVQIA